MTNDENTYIGMSLPEGIRYITVFEKGDFENCGRILRTFYRTEDRVRKFYPNPSIILKIQFFIL